MTAWLRHADIVALLLQNDADPNQADKHERNSLHFAAGSFPIAGDSGLPGEKK